LGIESELSYIDPTYIQYNDMIKEVIKKRIPTALQDQIDEHMRLAKKLYREEESIIRRNFKFFFSLTEKFGLKKSFEKIFSEMMKDGQINEFLFNHLVFEEDYLGFSFSSVKEEISNIDINKLNCTYVGIQGKIAYSYLASFEKGKLSKLRISDQVDVRHLFYLNYADVFVTDDEKILKITNNMIDGITSKVETTESFLKKYF